MTHILLHVPMMIISTLTRLAAADYGVYQRYPREIFTKMLLCNKIFVISNCFHGVISFWHRKVRARAGGGVPGEARTPYYEQQKNGMNLGFWETALPTLPLSQHFAPSEK